MKNICTVSDENYLYKGLTLYESLKKYNKNFKLHYFCIDDNTYDKIKKYESDSLIPYKISDFNGENQIIELKNIDYKYFCWSLASYFSNFLLTHKNIESITYIDSDIFFHNDIDILFNSIGNKDVAIFRHRQFPLGINRIEGYFNVGVIHFKNSNVGKTILNWWADAVLYRKYPHLSTCGDQKYLDEFVNICPKENIFIDGDIGHGAPWHWQLYDYSEYFKDGTIIWDNKKQLLLFSHFSSFKFQDNGYIPSMQHHIYTPIQYYIQIPELKLIHDNYFNEIRLTINKYK
jgi:hypothetical protein